MRRDSFPLKVRVRQFQSRPMVTALLSRPSGSPLVTRIPASESLSKLWLYLPAKRFCPEMGPSDVVAESMEAFNTPKVPDSVWPVYLTAPTMGTSSPLDRPMRRLKKGRTRLSPWEGPKKKAPESSKKKSRFSGKNRLKRVRLTWVESTSVSAKSVLYETESLDSGVGE